MLSNLSINNYALINRLNVSFSKGLTCITGETGAGKSILLGGLSLVLGKRADLSALRNKEQKCIIEAEFEIDNYALTTFFENNDLDYEVKTIIRREILPSGKSRAFVNDTPVTLDVLKSLGNRLVDVHSQHQTMLLANIDFQLKVIDSLALNTEILKKYTSKLYAFRNTEKELNELIEFQSNAIKEQEYNSFLLKELESAPLKEGVLEELEEQYQQLSNVEAIVDHLSKGHGLLNDEQIGVLNLFSELRQSATKLSEFGQNYETLNERIQSTFIELDDISEEIQRLLEKADMNPQLLDDVNQKLQLLYDLQKKHGVKEIPDLIRIKKDLFLKVEAAENVEADIEQKQTQLNKIEKNLNEISFEITKRRNKVIPKLKSQLEEKLILLGMPNARFLITLKKASSFKSTGKDDLSFLFSANKGGDFGELKKVASGGELSRIMLTIKSILAKYENLPTMMFDEIDTGVSGEISNRMGEIMYEMSETMQIFSITHLPQVASKGNFHFKVYKEDSENETHTNMRKLSREERVVELAEMLGGKDLSDSALAHAKQLLN